MIIEVETFETTYELIDFISEEFQNWPGYIFRGHANENWLLEPSLNRAIKNLKLDNEEIKDTVLNHLNKFKENTRGKLGNNSIRFDVSELIILGQHHGLKTTLLDWTWSPYIALFFAFSDISHDVTDYRVLWCMNCDDITKINDAYKNEDDKIEIFYSELDINKRIINQAGLLLNMPIGTNIEAWIENIPSFKWKTIIKIRINNNLRYDILRILDQMNINFKSIFPDLISASLDCNLKLSLLEEKDKRQTMEWKNIKK